MKIRKIKKKSKILVRAKLIAEQVLLNHKEYRELSIEDLKIRTDYLIEGLRENKFTLDDIVVDAFSIAREIINREYGKLAYEVQMMGAYVVHCGDFAEMYTGEGKSLTILLVAFLNALEKKGVHIVTVNEYLVQRDAEFAAKAFEKIGITVGYNTSKLNKATKKEMFNKDITYTTNSELGFDYLKDNMVRSIEEKVIRGLHFVIIDEGDSVLIDEARTPLIISGQPKEDLSLYLDIDKFVTTLSDDDYKIDNESNTISLTDSGVHKAEIFFKIDNLYSMESAEIVHKLTNALIAHFIFANGKEYLVKDDKIHLVDQFTGRVLEGRSYNAGLQQAIQAKERVKIEPENVVMATITYQSFFRLYDKLSAVSGTAMTEAEEFLKIYNMVVVRIPTNRPIIRLDKQDYIFGSKKAKWNHVIAEIVERHKTGQPILVGTASVSDSELIHERLLELNIPHEVLNARDNGKEAEIVKNGGQKGAITISTNMAGRGTDIKVDEEMKKIGGLYVIGTERHESRRIDNQLRGRTGRQGDPGESRFFISLEDSLFKRFATDKFEKASDKLEDEFYDSKFFSRMLDSTQKKVEGLNFDIRKNLMDYDHVLSLQRELIYKQRDEILLKTSNYEILNNMANDYVNIFINDFKNKQNSALIDARKLAEFINEEIVKIPFFQSKNFENQSLLVAFDKFNMIVKNIIEFKYKTLEELAATNVIDEILLVNLDQFWTKHIDKMTKLREGVNLRSLEQRSPLNIYIEDGNELFEKMKNDIVHNVVKQVCDISLPNESEKILERLQKLVESEEFKKKDNEMEYGQIEHNVDNNDKNELDDASNDNEKPLSKDDILTQSANNNPEVKKFKTEVNVAQKELENVNTEEEIEHEQLEEIIENVENKHMFYLNDISIDEDEGAVKSSEIFSEEANEWVETEQIIDEGNLLKQEEINKSSEIDMSSDNVLDPEQTPHEENIDNEEKILSDFENQEIIDNEIENDNEDLDRMSDEEIEKILNMPAFKDGESKLSLSEYLDEVLNTITVDTDTDSDDENVEQSELNYEYNNIEENLQEFNSDDEYHVQHNDENSYQQDDEYNQNEEDLNGDNQLTEENFENDLPLDKAVINDTPNQLREKELQEFRDELKEIINVNSAFDDEDFINYRKGFFKNTENKIDYSQYSENLAKVNANLYAKDDGVIKEFYKTPYVQKRKPGQLFGFPLSKYDKPLPRDATYEDYIKSKIDNAATQEQLNNLLFVDDERKRLLKINHKLKKELEPDQLINKKMDRVLSQEPEMIDNAFIMLNDKAKISDNFDIEKFKKTVDNFNHENDLWTKDATLYSEAPNIISKALLKNNDGILYDNEIMSEIYGDEYIIDDNQAVVYNKLEDENQEQVVEIDMSLSSQIININDEATTMHQKHVMDPYEEEIIKESRENFRKEKEIKTKNRPIHNLNKDIIDFLKRKNKKMQKKQ